MFATHLRTAAVVFAQLLLLTATPVRADYNYEYFEGSWSVLPDFAGLTPVTTGTVTDFDISPRLQDNQFGFFFTGKITVEVEGNYGFRTNSDDGSRLWIDDQLVVDNDGLHPATEVAGSIVLVPGTYNIEVAFFEQGGGQVLEVAYSPPGSGFRSIPSTGILEGPENPGEKGLWGPVITWPHVPVSAANLPDGRVVTWASNEKYAFPGGQPEFTYTGVWDPTTSVVTELDHPSHDMFCAHVVMLENGQPFVSGGRNSGNSPWTSVFDFKTDQWVPLNNMNRGRWYPTSVALSDGTIFTAIGSGGSNTGESYQPGTGTWQLETGLNFNPLVLDYPDSSYGERNWWPLFHLAPDGRIFHSGPTPQMHYIDTDGLGSATPVGPEFVSWYPKHGTTVMYEDGKLLTAGGWNNGSDVLSTNQAITIDISGTTPVVAATDPMHNARKFHNGVMLPNGEVLVVGGNTSGIKFNDAGSIYTAEIWNPQTGQWVELSASSVPRNYHSVALLLTDGTVLSAGGGLCNCSADHPDGQVYSPPYLFNPDGSPAVRPVITSAPGVIRAGDVFDVQTGTDITHFSLIKMSSTTHGINTDLRYMSVPFTGSSGQYELSAHANPNVLTPGYWMLFALSAQGTPSVAYVLQVQTPDSGDPPPQASLEFDFVTLGDLSSITLNGSAAGSTNVLRLTSDVVDETGSAFYQTPLDLRADTSFSTSMVWRSHGSADGAEGLAFVVQGNSSAALGAGAGGLGIGGVENSLVIELDNFQNAGGDPDSNHIGVTIGGDTSFHMATLSAPFDLEDGQAHRIWVDYNGSSNLLEIFLAADETATKPSLPAVSVPDLDLPVIVGSRAYFGFSAATSSLSNNHDIEAWSLAAASGSELLVIDPISAPPQPSDGPVSFSVSATGAGLTYSWSFGDGSPQTPFGPSSSATHTYSQPGLYTVTVLVRDVNGNEDTVTFVQAVHAPLASGSPVASSSIVWEDATGTPQVWNVNPDNDTVTVIDGASFAKLAEIPVGQGPRSIAVAPNGELWVANKKSSDISILSASTRSVVATRALHPGSQPHGLIIDEAGGFAYVALEGSGLVLKLDMASDIVLGSVDVGWNPRHVSLDGSGQKLFVSRFISPPLPGESTVSPQTTSLGAPVGGEVVVIDAATMMQTNTVVLAHSDRLASEQTGPGFPNYLGPAIVSPDGLTAWVPSKQDNILRGSSRNGLPLDHDHTVRAVTSVFDPVSGLEDLGGRVDHDNASVAVNGVFGKYGTYLFVALEGNRQVAVVDTFGNAEMFRFDVEFAPQGITISDDGLTVFVHNFLSRSVTVVDISALMNGVEAGVSPLAMVSTVDVESLPADVWLGKRLFYDARDSRLAAESYMSCASCHNEGAHDGRVWDLSSMGEGLRNTIDLRGHGGMAHGLLHWSANFDEVQDFENQIRALAGGTGLMSNEDFTDTQDTLGLPKAGLSSDLDALAAYVASLEDYSRSPLRYADGTLTTAGLAGQSLFVDKGCSGCHVGAHFTDSVTGMTHDVGTIKSSSGQRMGAPLDALDTPTLRGVWASSPYLHDGSAMTLREAIEAHDVSATGGAALTPAELDALDEYLAQVDDLEPPANLPPVANAGSDQQLSDSGADGVENVSLDGGGSADSDGTIVSYEWRDGGLPIAAGQNPTVAMSVGVHTIELRITDDRGAQATDQVVIDVVPVINAAPELALIGDQAVGETGSLAIGLSATDGDGDGLTFTVTDENDQALPGWFSLTDAGNGSGTLAVTPQLGDAGSYQVKVTVTDDDIGNPLSDVEQITVLVSAAPVSGAYQQDGVTGLVAFEGEGFEANEAGTGTGPWTVISDGGASGGQAVKAPALWTTTPGAGPRTAYEVNFVQAGDHWVWLRFRAFNGSSDSLWVDLDGQGAQLTYLTPNDGGWHWRRVSAPFTVSAGTRTLTIYHREQFAEVDKVVVTPDGAYAPADDGPFGPPVSAQGSNQAPVLALIGDQSVEAGTSESIPLSATDGDGDGLTFTATDENDQALPGWISVTDTGPGSGELAVAPQAGDAGSYQVKVRVTDDGVGNRTDEELLTLTVTSGGNAAPELALIGDQAVGETGSLAIGLSATDGDGDGLTFTVTDENDQALPGWFSLTDAGNGSGTLAVTPQLGDAGSYQVKVTVTDDDIGNPLSDVEQITVLVSAAPVSGAYQQDGVTGLVAFEGEGFEANEAGTGTGPWTVISDGGASGGQAVKAPALWTTTPGAGPRTAYEVNFVQAGDHWVWLRFRAFNSGSDSLWVDLDGQGAQLTYLTPNDGGWHWRRVSAPFTVSAGTRTLTIYHREQFAEVDKVVVTPDGAYAPADDGPFGPPVSAQGSNQAPVLALIGDQSVEAGTSESIPLSATDGDGDGLTFTATDENDQALPGWISVTDTGPGSGELAVAPQAGDAGSYQVKVRVTDDGVGNRTDEELLTLTVTSGGNAAPELALIGDQAVGETGSLAIGLSATDGDGDGLTFTVTDENDQALPGWFSLTDAGNGSGTLAVTPQLGDAGSYQVKVTVTDDDIGNPLSDVEQITVLVSAAPVSGAYQQDGVTGLVAFEGEGFEANEAGTGTGPWTVISDGGASGGQAVKAPALWTTTPGAGPRTAYEVNFVQAGDHWVWLRFRAFNGSSDSLWVDLDGQGAQLTYLTPSDGGWHWRRVSAPFTVSAGTRTLTIYHREQFAEVDKVVVTPDGAYAPADDGPFGPPVSSLVPD